ncbi:phosphoadenylyl-sulfate reductase [Amaricoccus sp.]|uniref:phosphoadenylyl-sulfate reductase n=1 Tax=Amaricoccus sp. TaxID=1872485 RepID=UPI002607037C|nr:phosphoadenylyl-sulfate reductase [uncultured Amaricoccus sp.]
MRLERDGELVGLAVDRVGALNLDYEDAHPRDVLAGVLDEFPGRTAMVSSFGADAAVLLHLVSQVDRAAPVLLVDTLMLFEETLKYQRELSAHLGLTNVQHVRPNPVDLARVDPDWTLNRTDQDACCDVRKVLPLERALEPYSVLITGRKRFQASTRAALATFEADGARLKVNPLAGWTARDLSDYMTAHDLPRHPLVARGYPSIGCAPCTTKVAPGEDPRAGRWRGSDKVECGIHFGADGRILRAS